jgi:hypothetical protein
MYMRESKQKRADGREIVYLQLAENVWDPGKGRSQARIVHNCGRADDPQVIETGGAHVPCSRTGPLAGHPQDVGLLLALEPEVVPTPHAYHPAVIVIAHAKPNPEPHRRELHFRPRQLDPFLHLLHPPDHEGSGRHCLAALTVQRTDLQGAAGRIPIMTRRGPTTLQPDPRSAGPDLQRLMEFDH